MRSIPCGGDKGSWSLDVRISHYIILGTGLYVHLVRVSKDRLYMRVTKCSSLSIASIYLAI